MSRLGAEELLYSGSIAGMPDEHASRRERFAEIDELQPGWTVELRPRGSTVDASFISPAGVWLSDLPRILPCSAAPQCCHRFAIRSCAFADQLFPNKA